jgi:hypothetical protein
MSDGLVKIAEYGDEWGAVTAQQFLSDNDIAARVFGSDVMLWAPQWELHVPESLVEEAMKLLKEFEADQGQAADEQAEGQEGEYPEADCEGNVE